MLPLPGSSGSSGAARIGQVTTLGMNLNTHRALRQGTR